MRENMHTFIKSTLATLVALSVISTAYAHEGHEAEDTGPDFMGGNFSMWASVGNERMFRGNSETQNTEIPAIQTIISWNHADTGIYAGYWAATVKFDIAPDVYAESGPFIGKAGSISDTGINYNVLLWHYMYHTDGSFADNAPDYTELYFQANKDFGNWNIAGEITPTLNDWFGIDGVKGLAYQLTPTYDLGNGVKVSGTLGTQTFYKNEESTGVGDWVYWDIGVAKTFAKGWKVDVRYHDTDLNGSSRDTSNIWKEHYAASVSKSF
jgi:uncharacterized protein (TIGR02001 family)